MNVLIIGGVAAGTKTAAKLKRENRDTEVTIITKGKGKTEIRKLPSLQKEKRFPMPDAGFPIMWEG